MISELSLSSGKSDCGSIFTSGAAFNSRRAALQGGFKRAETLPQCLFDYEGIERRNVTCGAAPRRSSSLNRRVREQLDNEHPGLTGVSGLWWSRRLRVPAPERRVSLSLPGLPEGPLHHVEDALRLAQASAAHTPCRHCDLCNEVEGKSMLAMSRDLGLSYKAAFVLWHSMRGAMAAEMRGRVIGGEGKIAEVDGGSFGGYVKPEPCRGSAGSPARRHW